MLQTLHADVALVGSGPVGAGLAWRLTRAGLDVLMLEAGAQVGPRPGEHLRNTYRQRSDVTRFHALRATYLDPVSGPANPSQEPRLDLLAAAQVRAVGGAGIVWSAIAPRLPAHERWPGLAWDDLYERAEALLGTRRIPRGESPLTGALCDALAAVGEASPAPMAVEPAFPPGTWHWRGPAEFLSLARTGPGSLRLMAEHAVLRLHHARGRIAWGEVRDLSSGRPLRVEARAWIVASGPFGTPQLLWASGIPSERMDETAVGRWLTEHPLAHALVQLHEPLFERAREGEPPVSIELPATPQAPFYRVVMHNTYDPRLVRGNVDPRRLVHLFWYGRMQPRRDNRVRFGPALDDHGLPRPTLHVQRDEDDQREARQLLADLERAVAVLGTSPRGAPPQLTLPGTAQHVMGTHRLSEADDGSGVVDSTGRVWGFDNLFLAGTGLIPGATTANPTLTGLALALRTGDTVVRALGITA
jgi:choline dehydrogenase-like flavoprotein